MDKLNKRQIIILSITALCVVGFAGYKFLIDSPASNKVKTNDKKTGNQRFTERFKK